MIKTKLMFGKRKDYQMRISVCAAIAIAAQFTSGCGVTLEAKRVATMDATQPTPSVIPSEGIVYALPKTELEVVQAVKLKIPTNGPLEDVFDTCRRACEAHGSDDTKIGDACDFSTKPGLAFLPPELRTVSVPDHSHLYQVSPAADVFQSLDFKFEIASNGVLDKADTAASNMAYEVVSAVLGTAIKAIGAAARPMAKDLKGLQTTKERNCYQASTSVNDLTRPREGKLSCSLAEEIQSCLEPFDKAVEREREVLNSLFNKAPVTKIDPKLLTTIAAHHREKIIVAIAKRDEAASLYGMGEGKPKEAEYRIVLPMQGPPEFENYQTEASLGLSIVSGKAKIAGISDNAAALLPVLTNALRKDFRTYVVATQMPTTVQIVKTDESATLGGGYRYRVPMTATTSLTVYRSSEAKDAKDILFGPMIDRKIIAQYGPIAALPSRFKGKGGRIMVKHWPDSGGLQTVELGAEAIPAASVTSVADEAFNQYKARKDKTEAAAAAAALADPELDSLSRQQKVLDLKKQIKDLEDALRN